MPLFRPQFVRLFLGLIIALLGGQPTRMLAQQNTGGGSVPSTSSPGSVVYVNSGATIYPNDPTQLGLQIQLRDEYFSKRIEREYLDQLGREPDDKSGRRASLPPALPVLAESVVVGSAADRTLAYRDKLVDYAGDTFFMACTSLVRQAPLSGKRSRHLQAYVSTRKKLLEDLRTTLAKAGDLPAGEKTAFLAGFAGTQSPALQALEADEESIRLELTHSTIFEQNEDGIGLPVIPPEGREFPPAATGLLFAVQFEPGLTATQRELLQGVAEDLGQTPKQATASFSFWPARARLPLPADLPADLIAPLQRLQQLKQQLVLELMEVLNRKRDASRTQALADLTIKQAPVLASLDTLADELRPRLAGLYRPAPDQPLAAPPELLRQVGRAYDRKAALQHDVTAELRELRRLLPNDKIALVQNGLIPSLVHTPGPASDQKPKLTSAEKKALRDRLKTTNAELERLTKALTKESQELQKSLREYRDKTLQAPDRDLNQLAGALGQTLAAQENERLYRDYRTAVLQPGLSLEQRRLLLRGALVDIERARLRDPWAE